MQKLEEDLDVVLFDVQDIIELNLLMWEECYLKGRILLEAADKLTSDAEALARGWEPYYDCV